MSCTTTPEEKRKRRLRVLSAKIERESAGGDKLISLNKTLAWAMIQWGSRKETIASYLEVLEAAGLIETSGKEDVIAWTGETE